MRKLLLLLPLVLAFGCHEAGPVALKAAKLRVKTMKMNAAKRGFRVRAVTTMEKQYDVNKNGIIDPQEAVVLRQRLKQDDSMKEWRKMDLDGDGVISSAEFDSYREDQGNEN